MPISIRNHHQRAILLIVSLYTIANGLMLINNGVFWDDWTLFNMSEQGIKEQFIGNGSWNTGLGYLHIWLQRAPNPAITYHTITFFLHLAISLLFFKILLRFNLDILSCLAIGLIAATVPLNQARVTMICLPYSISLFLFMLAFLLFINYIKNKSITIRIISLILFSYSFITNSLLVFYAIIPLVLIYFHLDQLKTSWRKLAFTHIDYLILPPLFWVVKNFFLKPQNFYLENNYNSFSIKRFVYAPLKTVSVLIDAFAGNIETTHQAILSYYFLFSLILLLFLYLRNTKFRDNLDCSQISNKKTLLITGLLILILAILPYVLIGKLPSYQGFETRHQLLMPFGYSILVFGLVTTLIKSKFRGLVLMLIVLFNIVGQIALHKQYLVGWIKQESIMQYFQEHPEISTVSTIQVLDQTPTLNATNDPLRFYEWNGVAKKIFNRQNQLYIPSELDEEFRQTNLNEFVAVRKAQHAAQSRNMEDYSPDGSCGLLLVTKGASKLEAWSSITRACYLYYFARGDFNQYIKKFITLEFNSGCPEFYPR